MLRPWLQRGRMRGAGGEFLSSLPRMSVEHQEGEHPISIPTPPTDPLGWPQADLGGAEGAQTRGCKWAGGRAALWVALG